jgi:hypothetical protein
MKNIFQFSLSAFCFAALNASAEQVQPVSASQTEHMSPFACNALALSPFRRMIVYPSLLRSVHARWDQAFGADRKDNNMNCRCDKHMLPFFQS